MIIDQVHTATNAALDILKMKIMNTSVTRVGPGGRDWTKQYKTMASFVSIRHLGWRTLAAWTKIEDF